MQHPEEHKFVSPNLEKQKIWKLGHACVAAVGEERSEPFRISNHLTDTFAHFGHKVLGQPWIVSHTIPGLRERHNQKGDDTVFV